MSCIHTSNSNTNIIIISSIEILAHSVISCVRQSETTRHFPSSIGGSVDLCVEPDAVHGLTTITSI